MTGILDPQYLTYTKDEVQELLDYVHDGMGKEIRCKENSDPMSLFDDDSSSSSSS